jgi:hypothetical protein
MGREVVNGFVEGLALAILGKRGGRNHFMNRAGVWQGERFALICEWSARFSKNDHGFSE